jgi:hypothetical protein
MGAKEEIRQIAQSYFMMVNRLVIKSMEMFRELKMLHIQDISFQAGFRTCRL